MPNIYHQNRLKSFIFTSTCEFANIKKHYVQLKKIAIRIKKKFFGYFSFVLNFKIFLEKKRDWDFFEIKSFKFSFILALVYFHQIKFIKKLYNLIIFKN